MTERDSAAPRVPTTLQEHSGRHWSRQPRPGPRSSVLTSSRSCFSDPFARGDARASSDIDLLVVAEGWPHSLADRRRPLLAKWARLRAERGLPEVEWNLVTKTPDEAQHRSPLYLDMVEDAVFMLDRGGFFGAVLDELRARMRMLGSRRIFLSDGSWYWDLKPDFRFGEVVEL